MYTYIIALVYTATIISFPLDAGQMIGLTHDHYSSKSIALYGGAIATVGLAASIYRYKSLRSNIAKREQDKLPAILVRETPLPKVLCDLVSEYANSEPIKLPFQLDRHLFYSDSTMKCAFYMVTPAGVLIRHAPNNREKPDWDLDITVPLREEGAETIQIVVDAFSHVTSDIQGFSLLTGICLAGTLASSYYVRRCFSRPSLLVSKIASITLTIPCLLGTALFGLFSVSSWKEKKRFSSKYPCPVPNEICDILEISPSKRKNYRCSRPKIKELNTLVYQTSKNSNNRYFQSIPVLLVDNFVKEKER